jgi:hypothetical protein
MDSAGTTGLRYLTDPSALTEATPEDAAALVKQLAGSLDEVPEVVCISTSLLSLAQRSTLIR